MKWQILLSTDWKILFLYSFGSNPSIISIADINWQCEGRHWILLELVLLEHIYPNMVCYEHVLHKFLPMVEFPWFLVS